VRLPRLATASVVALTLLLAGLTGCTSDDGGSGGGDTVVIGADLDNSSTVDIAYGRALRLRIEQENASGRETAQLRQERTASGVSENCAEDSQTRLGQHRLGCLVGAMAESHVRQLMCHHSSELCLIVSGLDRAAVHKHKSAGQSKGIDGFVIHAMKFERVLYPTRGQLLRQTRANLCQVSIDLRCVAKR